jgi:hypothetical protein
VARIIRVETVHDDENDSDVVCVQFDSEPTAENLKHAIEESDCPFPWGTALLSTYFEGGWWYDVGNA